VSDILNRFTFEEFQFVSLFRLVEFLLSFLDQRFSSGDEPWIRIWQFARDSIFVQHGAFYHESMIGSIAFTICSGNMGIFQDTTFSQNLFPIPKNASNSLQLVVSLAS
jgi:hypothetical protein